METLDLTLDFTDTHVLITGGAGYIGTSTVSVFLHLNASVTVLDLQPSKLSLTHPRLLTLEADISSENSLETAFATATTKFGLPTVCIAMAGLDLSVLPHHESLVDMPLEQWRRTFRTNVEGTFLTAREWLKGIKAHKDEELKNVSLVIVGSESGTFGERMNADYASSKSAIQVGLVQSLKGDVVRIYPRARSVLPVVKVQRSVIEDMAEELRQGQCHCSRSSGYGTVPPRVQ